MSRNSSILLAQKYCGIVAVLFMGIQNTYVVERASRNKHNIRTQLAFKKY